MFSNRYTTLWDAVKALSEAKVRNPDSLISSVVDFDASVTKILFMRDLGCSGKLDQTILAQSAAKKKTRFNGRLFPVVPIYATSICMEQCLYCNFRAGNKGVEIERVRLSDDELMAEARYLIEVKGLRVLELVYATDPLMRVDTMCRHVELLRDLLGQHGGGTVGINAEALEEEEYRRLLGAGLLFAVLWQETYDRERYQELHPGTTKKTNFEYRFDAYERMLSAGIRNIGMGVLCGLADWRCDWAMLMNHERYLFRKYGCGAAILGVPRLKQASGAVLQRTPFIPSRQEFLVAVALHNIFAPETMAFVNTREDWDLCVDLSNGGGCLFTFNCSTVPGGYSLGHRGYQFPTGSYDAPVFAEKLKDAGLYPHFNWSFNGTTPSVCNRNNCKLPVHGDDLQSTV